MPSKYVQCDECGATFNTEVSSYQPIQALRVARAAGWHMAERKTHSGQVSGEGPDLCPLCAEEWRRGWKVTPDGE